MTDKPRLLGGESLPAIEIEGDLRKPVGGRSAKFRQPALHDIDAVVSRVLAAQGNWVLVDRNVVGEGQSSTARYVALKRRGFEVASRHSADGVRNIWARWNYGPVDVRVPLFTTDTEETDFGADL